MPDTPDNPRRTRLPRAERERQILDAAHALFARRGFASVTMDDVASEVGVTKPLLYAYVGNKEQLYLAGVDRSSTRLQALTLAAIQGASSPDEAFRAAVGAFFSFVDSDRDAWRVLFADTTPADGKVAVRVREHRERMGRLIAAALVELIDEDHREAARLEVEALSEALLGAVESLARWWLRTGAMTADEAADLLVATVLPGLRMRVERAHLAGASPSPPETDTTRSRS